MPRKKIQQNFSTGPFYPTLSRYNEWPYCALPRTPRGRPISSQEIDHLHVIAEECKIPLSGLIEAVYELDWEISSRISIKTQNPTDYAKKVYLNELIAKSQDFILFIDNISPDQRTRLEKILIPHFTERGRTSWVSQTKEVLVSLRHHVGPQLDLDNLINCLDRDCFQVAQEVQHAISTPLISAVNFLLSLNLRQSRTMSEIKALGTSKGLSWATIKRAKKYLGVVSTKETMHGAWKWHEDAHQFPSISFKNIRTQLIMLIKGARQAIQGYQKLKGCPAKILETNILIRLFAIYNKLTNLIPTVHQSAYAIDGCYGGNFLLFHKGIGPFIDEFLIQKDSSYVAGNVLTTRAAMTALNYYRELILSPIIFDIVLAYKGLVIVKIITKTNRIVLIPSEPSPPH